MIAVVLLAIGVGVGIVGAIASVHPSRPTLKTLFHRVDRDPQLFFEMPGPHPSVWRADRMIGAQLSQALEGRSVVARDLKPWLNLTGSSITDFFSEVVLGASTGFALPLLCWAILLVGGLRVVALVPLTCSLLGLLCGGLLPAAVLNREVKRRRREIRRVVGTFLDLVVLCLAGGMGIEGAMHASARISDDPVSLRIGRALTLAQHSGATPWEALAGLGEDLGVAELGEVAAAVALAGSQGARIRSTLASKAASMRKHELADAEADANAITERLFLPGMLLLVGFLVFVGYPAVVRITSGF